MVNRMQFYIDGAWVDPVVKKSTPVVNPATEDAMYEVALGSKADLDKAVAAAKRAFLTYSQTSREERVALLEKIIEVYKGRMKEIGAAVSDEMGAPLPMAERLQAGAGLGHIASTLEVLKNYHFEETVGSAVVVREPVGVIGMITPWNWPLNQIACKVAPRARRRLHHDPQALGIHPELGVDLRGNPPRSRRAEGRVQPRQWSRPGSRRRDERTP
jgi:aldehyde dehydrogenase (NAD+)